MGLRLLSGGAVVRWWAGVVARGQGVLGFGGSGRHLKAQNVN